MDIGAALQEEAAFRGYLREQPRHFKKMVERSRTMKRSRQISHIRREMIRKGVTRARWSTRERASLGQLLLMIFQASTGLIEVLKYTDSFAQVRFRKGHVSKTHKIVVPSAKCLEWLKSAHTKHSILRPRLLPMVDVPIQWEGFEGGGYATGLFQAKPLVKAQRFAHEKALSQESAIPQITLDCINSLQEVRWEINKDVLEVFEHLWDNQVDIAGLGCGTDIVIEPYIGLKEDTEAYAAWRVMAKESYKLTCQNRSDRLLVSRILWVAKEFVDREGLYFPWSLDYRSRAYPQPFGLQPQGDDRAKGLLRFAEAKPIDNPEALKWFKVCGANHWGNDKVPFEERAAWVDENEAWICGVFEDPLECRDWAGADKPWQFLAWCLEYGAFLDDPENFKSKLPVFQDGSNNGLQIYSLLLRDPDGAVATNVSP